VGRPNAGKSTLLNRILGQKLSITSPKPQSTRDRVVGIHTVGDVQIVFYDTPGLMTPRYELQRSMRSAALGALRDADAILHLIDCADGVVPSLAQDASLTVPPSAPVLMVLNKIDLATDGRREHLRAEYPEAALVSAQTGEGVDDLVRRIADVLPEGPFLFPADDISAQSTRFFVSELIRETALEQLDDEVPYSVACEIEEYREAQVPVYIRAVLHVERDSQKRILIGGGGARVRAIGVAAREKIESLIGSRVYLDVWVKVLPNWRRDGHALRRFGYHAPTGDSS
jgi:GTP-binding protein Era